jgi:hypothetical protein
MACKKKLHIPFPSKEQLDIETQRTQNKVRVEPCDERSIERNVRQLLCNKISGNLAGIWLLLPEHLKLGTWDILTRWTHDFPGSLGARGALQLIHEAALTCTGKRHKRTLSQRGFEVANGLPYVISDWAVHDLLDSRTMKDAINVQIMLGKLRKALGHYKGRILAADPHRMRSYTRRQTPHRKGDNKSTPRKQLQTFFMFDVDTNQPICFQIGSNAKEVLKATIEIIDITKEILNPNQSNPLILADSEHYILELFEHVTKKTCFDIITPMRKQKILMDKLKKIPPEHFTKHWIGYATHKRPHHPSKAKPDQVYTQIVQRFGENEKDMEFNAFLCSSEHAIVEEPIQEYPKRWHCEEFFNANQALGWDRAGTLNLNVRFGHMTMAIITQTLIHMFKENLGKPWKNWDAKHLAKDFFAGLEGDLRIHGDKIIVTYYNAPEDMLLRKKYTNLPLKLENEGINPKIPWLFDYKLDFRFK